MILTKIKGKNLDFFLALLILRGVYFSNFSLTSLTDLFADFACFLYIPSKIIKMK